MCEFQDQLRVVSIFLQLKSFTESNTQLAAWKGFLDNFGIFLAKNYYFNCMRFFSIIYIQKRIIFFTFCHFIILKCHFVSFLFPSMASYHISAQYFNGQNYFACLIPLILEMKNIILCDLREQGVAS